MANGYYDFSANGVSPYVGIGVGVAQNKLGTVSFDLGGIAGNVPGDTKTGVAFSIMLGASIPLEQTLVLDVGYRYIDLGEVQSKAGGDLTAGGVVTGGAIVLQYPGATGK